QAERQAEIDNIALLLASYPPLDLQRKGLALCNLQVTGMRSGLGGQTIVDYEPLSGTTTTLPPHKFQVGDIASAEEYSGKTPSAKKGGQKDGSSAPTQSQKRASGVVYRISETRISLVFKEDPPVDFDKWLITRTANATTYDRIVDALKHLRTRSQDRSTLLEVLFGRYRPEFRSTGNLVPPPALNEPQVAALHQALSTDSIALIHGPPGTGKTHTVVEIVKGLVARGERVLVCAGSNIGVDNLVERLSHSHIPIVRLGHPARILPAVLAHALEVRVRTSDEGQIIKDVKEEVDSNLASVSKAKNRSERRSLYANISSLRKELRAREKKVAGDIISGSRVVLATLSGAASNKLAREEFDTVVIDESTQATEGGSKYSATSSKSPQFSKQPAKSSAKFTGRSAGNIGESSNGDSSKDPELAVGKLTYFHPLERTLFDRMVEVWGDDIVSMLILQYRMHEAIMSFSSSEFYQSRLIAHQSVRSHLLKDLPSVKTTEDTEHPIVFIDTAGMEMYEREEGLSVGDKARKALGSEEGGSKYNEHEIEICVAHVRSLISTGLQPGQICIISPYSAQVERIQAITRESWPNLEVGTVDGFQGREKEAVVVSCVRSNEKGIVGFLAERRRMNVALTRARRHLCVVGDSETLGKDAFLNRMCEYLTEHGDIRGPQ
ncbi:hypothetical protein HDU93_001411, partial [Gonapodya sp. JEL0774]